MEFVQQQFFPSSDRLELIVDWNLPQNASIDETNDQMARFEKEMLAGEPDVDHWSTYVGQGAPRFVLSFDVQPANTAFGQTVILTKSHRRARPAARANIMTGCARPSPARTPSSTCSTSARRWAARCNIASAARTSTRCATMPRALGNIVANNRHLGDVTFDWMEPARMVKVECAAGQGAPRSACPPRTSPRPSTA